ncbi:MAG: DUF1836 domain-containing protein [Clostridia bacterium]|nr:DUF1836 domain-containing protein [Clostridia bacterium]
MPRYREIPNMGLYLDQTIKYINQYLEPLGCMEITSSMVSNYVKKGYIKSPVKKQYDAEQIAYLFFIAVAKNVLSMESIAKMFGLMHGVYTEEVAYDYFCSELENVLNYIFGEQDDISYLGTTNSEEKDMLRSVIVAVANVIYVNDKLKAREPKAVPEGEG